MDHLEANLKKKIWKYAAAIHAMTQAGSMAEARFNLGRDIDGPIHDGFMDAIATCYYRPFTNNGEGAVGALDSRLVREINPDLESVHRMLREHRMMSAAHSDPRITEGSTEKLARDITLLVTKLPGDGINIGHKLPAFRIGYEHLDRIIALISDVMALVRKHLEKAIGDLYYEEEGQVLKEPIKSVWEGLPELMTAEIELNLHEALAFSRGEQAVPAKSDHSGG